MRRPQTSRRQLFGASAALLLLAPPAIGAAKADEIDGRLLRLCADMEERQADVTRVSADPTDGDLARLDEALDDWWETVVDITRTPARTPEGVRAKAMAVRTTILGTGGDQAPMVTSIIASLLSDMLGEPVDLPGME